MSFQKSDAVSVEMVVPTRLRVSPEPVLSPLLLELPELPLRAPVTCPELTRVSEPPLRLKCR